jgi:3-deoxy-D-manno-octulosonate 8-phosphate phosphatase (KDO 8-P phosphatase)
LNEIERTYLQLGGKFITPFEEIKNKLKNVKAFIYDWDGVYNNGEKSADSSSNFSEVDSMGANLLRYSHFLINGQQPLTGIISGEKNATAFYFCKRECFHYSFFKLPNNKVTALNFICEKEKLKPSEVAYFFDDVLDLAVAEICGIRVLIGQKANPLFADYCVKNKLVDYLTASRGGDHAVREATELLIALNGNYEEVISGRKNNVEQYRNYLAGRQAVKTKHYSLVNGELAEVTIS